MTLHLRILSWALIFILRLKFRCVWTPDKTLLIYDVCHTREVVFDLISKHRDLS